MKIYIKPEVKNHFQTFIALNQYLPECSADFTDQCIDESGSVTGGPTGATCSDPNINVTVFVTGAIDTSSFPCELLINGSPVAVSFGSSPIAVNCAGQDGIAYFLTANVGSCPGAVSSVAVSCESGSDNCPLVLPQ